MTEMPSFVSQHTSGLPHQSMEQCSNCTPLFCLFICEEINGTIKIKDQSINLCWDNCLLFCVGTMSVCLYRDNCLFVCVGKINCLLIYVRQFSPHRSTDNSLHTGQQSILPTQVDRQFCPHTIIFVSPPNLQWIVNKI